MSDEPATSAPNTEPPADHPTAEKAAHPADVHGTNAAHAPAEHEAPTPAPEAEAGVEKVTAPDPAHAPEPAPAPPPELAEPEVVANRTDAAAHEAATSPAAETSEVLVPVEEPASEELVPVHAEPANESAEAGTAAPEAETPAEPVAEAPKPAKPRKPRAPKAPKAVEAAEGTPDATVTPTEGAPAEPAPESKKKWYAIKVQSGREDSIKAAILRKVHIEGLEDYFGRIEIPVEEVVEKKSVKVKDKKTGETTYQEKKVTRKRKKFQGYLFAELEFNDRILYLFRETSGVGDFLNLRQKHGQPPTPEPMPEHEVQAMLTGERHKDPLAKKVKIDFEKGDKVRIKEGPFANSEGEVKVITEPKDPTDTPKITVVVTLWGRPVDVDLESSQVEKV